MGVGAGLMAVAVEAARTHSFWHRPPHESIHLHGRGNVHTHGSGHIHTHGYGRAHTHV